MDHASIPIAAFILAGGKSTRMGTDKAFVTLGGRALLARMLDLARSVTPEVRIVGEASKYAPFANVVEDLFPGCGPLGGIHAALRSTSTEINLILAVDIPFASLALLQFLITRTKNSSALVTVARSGGRLHPLCAVYRREFAQAAENALREGRYKIDALFDQVATQVIGEEELELAGFAPRIFRNLNTPQDLVGEDLAEV
jgi:molybdenum cofactor guanylyltransferase